MLIFIALIGVIFFFWKLHLEKSHGYDQSWIISPHDTRNKISTKYRDCLGVGIITRKDGINYSTCTHGDPLHINFPLFQEHFRRRLRDIKDQEIIALQMFGGYFYKGTKNNSGRNVQQEHLKACFVLQNIIYEELGRVIDISEGREQGNSLTVKIKTQEGCIDLTDTLESGKKINNPFSLQL